MSKQRAHETKRVALREVAEGAEVIRGLKKASQQAPLQSRKTTPLVGRIDGFRRKVTTTGDVASGAREFVLSLATASVVA
jgi:hypothetical protein